ncbi:HWE histidine kinase domain-containing protein [Bradyrhizobium canariense]|uniref:Blue-light-activated histidine kinase n=1 Tax=Bradyrhizobium canariense TaxID=255045 RepID=A0A1H1SCL7_9BRAD|nr:HWE histidine kinase domain-containing protein [Bradyrhizobium canariense]SDS45671.1 PAS domain S-box-containing protein [Bradyrhizobium canariense]
MADEADRNAKADQPTSLTGLPFAQQPALQLIYDTAPIGLAFLSPDCRYLQINQRLTEICGISVEGHLGRTVRECVPALAETVEAIMASIMATGEPVAGIEVAGQRPDQIEDRAWITYWHPVRGPDREIVGINVAAEEITERKRVEAALLASERQFHTLADSIPQLVWMAEADGAIFWFNGHWYDYTGVPAGDTRAHDWQTLLDPALLLDARRCWTQSLQDGTAFEMELSLLGKDGKYRPFLTRAIPLRDTTSTVYRWIGTHIDISEQRRREEHIRFIIDELSHRTKNLLAVVMAVANQTAQHAGDVGQYQMRFSERLQALAHCHDLLVKDNWHGASLRDLVSAQMRPFGETNAGRIDAAGPPVILKPDAVQHLGLALHELATNASKHGALSGPQGEVLIRWQVGETDNRVRIHWREQGGPPVAPPQRRGFGHVVIEQIVPRALNGSGKLDFSPAGVNWTFKFLHH